MYSVPAPLIKQLQRLLFDEVPSNLEGKVYLLSRWLYQLGGSGSFAARCALLFVKMNET